jgi:hypothetical protein
MDKLEELIEEARIAVEVLRQNDCPRSALDLELAISEER